MWDKIPIDMGILLNVQLMYVYTPARKGDILVTNSPQVSMVLIDHGVRMSQWRCLCLMLASLRDPDWPHHLHPLEQSLLSHSWGENLANHAQILKLLPGSGMWCSHSYVLGWSESSGPAWLSRTWGNEVPPSGLRRGAGDGTAGMTLSVWFTG